MSRFASLSPAGLPEAFEADLSSEKPIIAVDEQKDRIEINYIFPGFTIGDVDQQIGDETLPFKEVGIAGAGFVSESGKPLLPSFGRFVQIPSGCTYEVSVKKSKLVKFEDMLITPAQEQATDQAGSTEEFEYDAEAYREDGLYPTEVVEVSGPQNLDDYKVLLIHVRPLQYNAAKRQLIGYSNIKVTIKLSAADMDAAEMSAFPPLDPSVNREGFGNLLLNPRRHIAERIPVRSITGPIVLVPRGPEYLIIYDPRLKSAAEDLANWKNHKGLISETVSINTVGNTTDAIKKYIRDRRSSFLSRLRYVLLLGDVATIAAEQLAGTTTDHYYFTAKDPANANDCVLPWVSGGRIPVNSLAEAQAVVKQIIDYERTPPSGPDYYRRMTFAAYFQDDYPQDGRADRAYMKTMESIREHLISLGFTVARVYVSNNPNPQLYKDGTAVPAAVSNAIVTATNATTMLIAEAAEGQLLIGHRDHGSEDGWAHPPFHRAHLPSILSTSPSIFYSVNCLTGRFDYDPNDCFAEAILELHGGAPSLIAATELSGTWRNDSLMKGLFDAMWPGIISTFPGTTASYPVKYHRIGDILNYGKAYLLVAHGANSGVRNHFEIYHVLGDPTLQLWADEPALLKVVAGIRQNILQISVNPAPADAVMTIWYLGKQVKRITLSSTRLSIPIGDLGLEPAEVPPARRYIEVCVSAPGHRYAQTRVALEGPALQCETGLERWERCRQPDGRAGWQHYMCRNGRWVKVGGCVANIP